VWQYENFGCSFWYNAVVEGRRESVFAETNFEVCVEISRQFAKKTSYPVIPCFRRVVCRQASASDVLTRIPKWHFTIVSSAGVHLTTVKNSSVGVFARFSTLRDRRVSYLVTEVAATQLAFSVPRQREKWRTFILASVSMNLSTTFTS